MLLIQNYWMEFFTIATVHLLAVASPGPDFAVVLKHSISFGRRAAVLTSIGVGLGILVHVAYSLLGIGLLIKTTPWIFNLFSYVAAGYLAYLGWGAIRSQPSNNQSVNVESSDSEGSNTKSINEQTIEITMSDKKAFWIGLLTNGLNPKATVFFLSLFAVVVSAQTPNSVKLFYGLYLAVATGIWFCMLSYVLSSKNIRAFIQRKSYWFDRVMGAILILLAVKLVTSGAL